MKTKYKIAAIVAMDQGRAIGFQNGIPWSIPEDQKRFSQLTKGHTVLMGRKTYQSLPDKFRPLPGRKNLVITRNKASFQAPPSVTVFESVSSALSTLSNEPDVMSGEVLWIIGGGEIYRETLDLVDEIYLTLVTGSHQGDVFFPDFEAQFEQIWSEKKELFEYRNYRRKR